MQCVLGRRRRTEVDYEKYCTSGSLSRCNEAHCIVVRAKTWQKLCLYALVEHKKSLHLRGVMRGESRLIAAGAQRWFSAK